MDKKLPELFFSTSNKRVSEYQKRLRDEGLIRKVAPRLYSSVPEDEWPEVIPRNWAFIIDKLFPGTLLSYRSAMEFTPSPDGTIYLTSGTTRVVSYPGLRISFLRGPAPLEDDGNFLSNLRSSSLPRACLENLRPLRSTNKKRIWPREQLESRLEEYLRINGENFINTLRDRAKEIAVGFGWLGEFEKLNQILGAIPGTRRLPRERSLLVKPFDSRCLERLTSLYSYLKTTPLKSFPETLTDNNHFRNKAFFESYFSNYIEGTTFKIEEAEQIIENEVSIFKAWNESRTNTILEPYSEKFEIIRQQLLEEYRRQFSVDTYKKVDKMTKSLVHRMQSTFVRAILKTNQEIKVIKQHRDSM